MLNVLRRALSGRGASNAAPPQPDELGEVTEADRSILERALPFTMTGPVRLQALVDAVRYVVRRGIPGDFAECGVWRGGSVMAMIFTLQQMGEERDIWLYDTFEGLTEPTEADTTKFGEQPLDAWRRAQARGERVWHNLFGPELFNEDAVRRTLLETGYPADRVHMVAGKVEDTLPVHMPSSDLAILRLDTDWYESTRHELEVLYPRLASGGVLIIDDYGHFDGARRAVDEYFDGDPVLLHRIDYTGRTVVKA